MESPITPSLHLVWTGAPWRPQGWTEEVFELAPGLHLVRGVITRSRLYHRVKGCLPAGSPLLVGELRDAPKFKGLARGAAAFARGSSDAAGRRRRDEHASHLGLI